jgi:hypothetical protein
MQSEPLKASACIRKQELLMHFGTAPARIHRKVTMRSVLLEKTR